MPMTKVYKVEMTPVNFIVEQEVLKVLKMPSKKALTHINKLSKKVKSGTARFLDVAVLAKLAELIGRPTK